MAQAHGKKLALVTGVGKATGLGLEICRQLAKLSVEVILTARNGKNAEELTSLLRKEGLSVTAKTLDLEKPESIQLVVSEIEKEYGRLDILINNAAAPLLYGETIAGADLTAARAVFETNIFGTWNLTRTALPMLEKSEQGRIVNVSSGAGSHGDPVFGLGVQSGMGVSYGISKAAVNAFTSILATELKNTRIKVNSVCPGFTATFTGGEAMGARPVSEGAKGIVWAALLPDDGPSGGFFRDGLPLPW